MAKQSSQSQLLPRGPHGMSAVAVGASQRQRLLKALPRAVAEHGYERTTVEHIVRLAQVRRSSFYEQFESKQDCFAIAYEIGQERLLGVLTLRCYTSRGLAERLAAALEAGLELLAANPDLARLLVVEAPAAGEQLAVRHQAWLDRYGKMLRLAAVDGGTVGPSPGVEPAVLGGLVSRIKQLVLAGEAADLTCLRPELVRFALSFYSAGGDRSPRGVGDALPQPQSGSSSVLEPV